MRKRSLAREITLQVLYQREMCKNKIGSDLTDFCQSRSKTPEIQAFARELIMGVQEKQNELDRAIKQTLVNWEFTRLAIIDRIILQMGSYEIMFRPDIPPVVAINEAVDLAKKYSTRDSGAFVNGVLDKILSRHKVSGRSKIL